MGHHSQIRLNPRVGVRHPRSVHRQGSELSSRHPNTRRRGTRPRLNGWRPSRRSKKGRSRRRIGWRWPRRSGPRSTPSERPIPITAAMQGQSEVNPRSARVKARLERTGGQAGRKPCRASCRDQPGSPRDRALGCGQGRRVTPPSNAEDEREVGSTVRQRGGMPSPMGLGKTSRSTRISGKVAADYPG